MKEALLSELEEARLISARHPSHGDPFTRRTIAATHYYFGISDTPRHTSVLNLGDKGTYLVNNQLGRLGRFGNQILQYGACRTLAELTGAIFLYPTWAGSVLFNGAQSAVPNVKLDSRKISIIDADTVPQDKLLGLLELPGICELTGYFGAYPALMLNNRATFKQAFTYIPRLETALQEAKYKDLGENNNYLAVHVRKGDFTNDPDLDTPLERYVLSIKLILERHPDLNLVLLTDDDAVTDALKKTDMSVIKPAVFYSSDLQFVYEHYLIRTAPYILLAPNSTFSYTAALLSDTCCCPFLPTFNGAVRLDVWAGKTIETYTKYFDNNVFLKK